MSAAVIAFHNYGWLLVPLRPLYGLFKGCFGNLVVPDFAENSSRKTLRMRV
ncbi:hypothetical protein PORCRE_931 [Porphyromonas crevioricanis JCM 15906]|uniref:Uncharacterized protein n=1 Tax=Porphyromonas crevioricanis JCM 15906 TaxID=1305617 RepID=T1CHA3_9PORP|nr:hypothetical protein PORCRE_931 [Porphyromonas crevioricanis JCM 15906]